MDHFLEVLDQHCLAPLLALVDYELSMLELVRGNFYVHKLGERPVLLLHITNRVFPRGLYTVPESTLPVTPPHKLAACCHSSKEEVVVVLTIPQEVLIVASEFKPFLLVEPDSTMRHPLGRAEGSFFGFHFGKEVEDLCKARTCEVVCIDIVHDVSGRHFESYIPGMRHHIKLGLCCVDVDQDAGFDVGHHIALHPLIQLILAVVVDNHELHVGIISVVMDVDGERNHQIVETIHAGCAEGDLPIRLRLFWYRLFDRIPDIPMPFIPDITHSS